MVISASPVPFAEPVFVTRPIVPPMEEFVRELESVWRSGWFANGGAQHRTLEDALRNTLGARHLSLFNNGTIALTVACRALRLSGEVITTPFTFPATPHVLSWNNITPVFADIDPVTMTIDPTRIGELVTERTTGILGVHVYGMACDVDGIQKIAEEYGLRVLYDGAHSFGTEVDGRPVAQFGDATMFSFHATKLFHSAEGGALAVSDPLLKNRIDLLKNFGIKNENEVVMPGINGKMNEIQAALGLVVLRHVDAEREARGRLAKVYDERLGSLEGVSVFSLPGHVRSSMQYYVIRVDEKVAPVGRDRLYEKLREFNVFSRRYFHPLCSSLNCYRSHPSASPQNLPVANRIAGEVLALPFFGALGVEGANRVSDMIHHIFQNP